MKFRGMFPDWFRTVEAATEEEARMKLLQMLLDDLRAEDFVVWPEQPDQAGGDA
jgi:hypothetical protein